MRSNGSSKPGTQSFWAKTFARALRQWLFDHDLQGQDLARILGIPISTWQHAASGNNITQTEYYARIYCYTAIPEADPRTIPPRGHGNVMVARAMDESQWQAWFKTNSNNYLGTLPVPQKVEPPPDIEVLILQLKVALQAKAQGDAAELEAFLAQHGPQLGQLYKLVSAMTIPDPTDRKVALAALKRYTKR